MLEQGGEPLSGLAASGLQDGLFTECLQAQSSTHLAWFNIPGQWELWKVAPGLRVPHQGVRAIKYSYLLPITFSDNIFVR